MSDIQDEGQDLDVERERMEADARRQGWRPQEEYTGNPKQWVDADVFLARGAEIRSFTKKENEQLRRQLADATRRLEEQGKTIEEIREYHAKMEERAIAAAVTRLKSERKQAVASGDMALAAELDEEIEELREAPSAVPGKKDTSTTAQQTPVAPTEPAEVTTWKDNNATWYNDDPENEDLVAYADGMAQKIGRLTDLSIDEKLEELTRRVKKAFPDRFGTRQRTAVTTGTGQGGGREGSRRGSKSVASLPPDARAAGERFVKQKLYKDLEEYAVEYYKQLER